MQALPHWVDGTQCQRCDRERGVSRSACGENTAAEYEQVLVIMSAAVFVDHRIFRIGAHPRRAHDVPGPRVGLSITL